MRYYLESCHGHCTGIEAAPRSRKEAIELIHEHFPVVAAGSSFRFVSAGSLEISANESYEIETLTLGLRHYRRDVWGLTEASVAGQGNLPADFHPTFGDLSAWLTVIVTGLQVKCSLLRIELERVEDFHVLQVSTDAKLLKSITWNVPAPTESHFRLPRPDSDEYLWGDALITDIGLVCNAVTRLKASLLPVVEVVQCLKVND